MFTPLITTLHTAPMVQTEILKQTKPSKSPLSPRDEQQMVCGIYKQRDTHLLYQNHFTFYLDLWYLSSLFQHDSNYSHQGVPLETLAKNFTELLNLRAPH